jgi:hypothetical protein
MNSYKIVIGVDVSKNSFTAIILHDNKKETFEVKSDHSWVWNENKAIFEEV